MYSLSILIAVAAVAVVVGCLIGALLGRSLSPQQQKAKALESQLAETKEQLKDYQQEVTEHFAETAKLVNSLTQSYKDVHEHLATNALKLANVDISRQLLSNSDSESTPADAASTNTSDENFEPPRDWAPKAPGSEGTLSESYGLKEEYSETNDPTATKSH